MIYGQNDSSTSGEPSLLRRDSLKFQPQSAIDHKLSM
jgi:hypothetical protein